ncbi:MAG: hypothetical protein JST75_05070 [Bacteroidetes bacterium]|nr:hypothetical protein [Bacteroidota bacterium]
MKKILTAIVSTIILLNFTGCNKSNPTNQKNSTSKVWLVKDISSGGAVACSFNYNDQGQITSVTRNIGPSNDYTYRVVYNSQGKIDSFNIYQGPYLAYPAKIIYEGSFNFVFQSIPLDTVHFGLTTYGWNSASENEIDEIITQGSWVSGSPYGPSVRYYDYFYDPGGGIHGASSHYIQQRTENLWALSEAGTGPTIPNPFHKDRSNEQNYVYFSVLKSVMQDILVMANGLPNGVFEAYRDSSGVQLTVAKFYFTYSLDSNKNVNRITEYMASNRPALNQYPVFTSWDITYEQH